MDVNLGDIIPTSTVDWQGKVVMAVFLRGCPFKCPYCSNPRFIEVEEGYVAPDVAYVKDEILKAKDFIDAVVFSGGEPLQQPAALEDLASFVKGLRLLVGVQTNGAYPERLQAMADKGLVDSVMLDVKAPLRTEQYARAIGQQGRPDLLQAVKSTLELCGKLRADGRLVYYETRTTVFRGLADMEDEVCAIAASLKSCDAYVLQQGRPEIAMEESFRKLPVVSHTDLLALAKAARSCVRPQNVKRVKVRTVEFGDETVS